MTNEKEKLFSDQIMGEISKRNLGMRPKWHFTIITVGLGLALFFVAVLTTIFLSLGFFRIRHINPINFINFGNTGWLISLKIIPWELIVFVIVGALLTWMLIRRFDISYKIGFWLLAVILVGVFGVVSVILDRNQFGEQIERSGILPLLVSHESVGNNWVEGKIDSINNDGFEIESHTGKKIPVVLKEQTKPQGNNLLKLNNTVRVIGVWNGKDFMADIVEVDENDTNVE